MTTNYLKILAQTIQENWDAPALTDFYLTEDGTAQDTTRGNHYTYGEMYAELCRVADYLERLGLQKGDHIAICGANSAHWVIAYLAIAKMQGVSVTIMHSLMPEQIAALVHFSDAKALFTDEDIWAELQDQSMPQVQTIVSLADWRCLQSTTHRLITDSSLTPHRDISFPHDEPDALAMICFTSGSTGNPKGVMLAGYSISEHIKVAHDMYPLGRDNSYVSFLPLAHTAGLIGDVLAHIVYGNHIMLNKNEGTITNLYNCIKIVKPYMFIAVPMVLEELYTKYGDKFIQTLKYNCRIVFMGMAKWGSSIENIVEILGIPLCTGYSQTEAGSSICLTPYKQYKKGASGKLVSGYLMKFAENGEILVKGENVMLGYYKNPEATAQKIDADGWLHTGDRGHLDEDGYLYVEGRLEQDMIVLPNGENIHPDNIERKINALPEVAESIVIARGGNLVAIVVPSAIEHQDLRRFILRTINPQLPSYSQLYDVECINEPLARTAKQTLKRYLYK